MERTHIHGCLPQELKKEVMEHRLILDTVNEVSRALLELVPWRAREGLDKLVSDTNERYKLVSDTIKQRVEEIDAAIQRSQQVGEMARDGAQQQRGAAGMVADPSWWVVLGWENSGAAL